MKTTAETLRGTIWILVICCIQSTLAEPPEATYIFPAGGQRGQSVEFRVGGLFFHGGADFAMLGEGVQAKPRVEATETIWFEGPLIHQPLSQRSESYPRDNLGSVKIAKNAALGPRFWTCKTVQGLTQPLKFVVGEHPEIVEAEIDGAPIPEAIPSLPVTVNGRIFPREDVDFWDFDAPKGELVVCEAVSSQLGYPLQPVVEIHDPAGNLVAVKRRMTGDDPTLWFRAPVSGRYRAKIRDASYGGLQNYVYRLTLSHGPHPTTIFPLGGRRGELLSTEVSGLGMEPEQTTVELAAEGDSFPVGRFHLHVGDLPEFLEGEAKELVAPSIGNGRISAPGEVDRWFVDLAKQETASFAILAAKLGSRLDSSLKIVDAEGRELRTNDDGVAGNPDSALTYTAPKAGRYEIQVSDQFGRGGPDFAYRLKVSQPSQKTDFRLTLGKTAMNVTPQNPPADGAKPRRTRGTGIPVTLEGFGGFKSDVTLEADGLPEGVTMPETKISFRRKTVELFFDAVPETKPQIAEITIRGTAILDKKTGESLTREATISVPLGHLPVDRLKLAVAPFVPFRHLGQYSLFADVPAGSTLTKHYELQRFGYDGPVTVRLGEHQGRTLQGITGPVLEVPAGATEFDYTIHYPARMELGRTARIQLMLEAEVPDADGKPQTLSYTSFERDNQIITIAGSGQLSLTTPKPSLLLEPNQPVSLPVRIKRGKALEGRPVRVELLPAAHLREIVASEAAMIPGNAETAELTLNRAESGAINAPLLIRASTCDENPDRHVADLLVEIVE